MSISVFIPIVRDSGDDRVGTPVALALKTIWELNCLSPSLLPGADFHGCYFVPANTLWRPPVTD